MKVIGLAMAFFLMACSTSTQSEYADNSSLQYEADGPEFEISESPLNATEQKMLIDQLEFGYQLFFALSDDSVLVMELEDIDPKALPEDFQDSKDLSFSLTADGTGEPLEDQTRPVVNAFKLDAKHLRDPSDLERTKSAGVDTSALRYLGEGSAGVAFVFHNPGTGDSGAMSQRGDMVLKVDKTRFTQEGLDAVAKIKAISESAKDQLANRGGSGESISISPEDAKAFTENYRKRGLKVEAPTRISSFVKDVVSRNKGEQKVDDDAAFTKSVQRIYEKSGVEYPMRFKSINDNGTVSVKTLLKDKDLHDKIVAAGSKEAEETVSKTLGLLSNLSKSKKTIGDLNPKNINGTTIFDGKTPENIDIDHPDMLAVKRSILAKLGPEGQNLSSAELKKVYSSEPELKAQVDEVRQAAAHKRLINSAAVGIGYDINDNFATHISKVHAAKVNNRGLNKLDYLSQAEKDFYGLVDKVNKGEITLAELDKKVKKGKEFKKTLPAIPAPKLTSSDPKKSLNADELDGLFYSVLSKKSKNYGNVQKKMKEAIHYTSKKLDESRKKTLNHVKKYSPEKVAALKKRATAEIENSLKKKTSKVPATSQSPKKRQLKTFKSKAPNKVIPMKSKTSPLAPKKTIKKKPLPKKVFPKGTKTINPRQKI